MNTLFSRIAVLALSLTVVVCGCSDDDDNPTPPSNNSYTVSGTLDIKEGVTVPETAELVVIWLVDAAGDYAYLHGHGTYDLDAGTFSIAFDGSPASEAMNGAQTGLPSFAVGFVVLGDVESTAPHKLGPDELDSGYGALNNTGIIFVDGDPSVWAPHNNLFWLADFTDGYSIGVGQETGGVHDIFVPASAGNLVLTISDDEKDFHFPNWK